MNPSAEKLFTPTPEQRNAANPAQSVWVAASAGSGKTHVLVDRVIRLLLEGAAPDAILCLTFTKAAAAEMSNRLFQRLSGWTGLGDDDLDATLARLGVEAVGPEGRSAARKLFARALETPGGLKIQTIHAFCEGLLQRFPVESGMAPGFRVMEEQETQALFREALLSALASEDSFTREAFGFLDDGSITTLEALETLARKFLSASSGMRQRLSDENQLALTVATLKKLLGISSEKPRALILDEVLAVDEDEWREAYARLLPHETNRNWGVFKALLAMLDAKEPAARLEAMQKFLLTGDGAPRKAILKVSGPKEEPTLAAWLDDQRQHHVASLQELAQHDALQANLAIYRAMAAVLARINTEKRARGLYDFDDLIARTARLLETHEAAQWVLYKLDKGLSHILVDEAQDTSPAQWSIIRALAGEFFTGSQSAAIQRTVFAVGDIKQSIYSFQGADIEAFEAARTYFEKATGEAQQPFRQVDLTVSYRSNQQVLDAVDQVFAPGHSARAGFGPRAENERAHTAYNKDRPGLVEFWDLELPDQAEEHDNWRAPLDLPSRNHPRIKLADRIARTIKGWLGQRQLSGQGRAVAAGDILILLQSRNDLFNALIAALRRHGVPVAGADRLKLQQSLIVKDLLALGQFIRMPDDDHNLACLLKSPLVPEPLEDEALFQLAYGRQSASLWSRLPEGTTNRATLEAALTSTETPFMLFARVLQQSRRSILERLGQEAEDASQEFLSLALDYEQQSGTSLIGFLDWFVAGETEVRRDMEQGSGQLRLMTVHGSKGLEAPIVFLADAADPPPSKRDKLITVLRNGAERGMLLFESETVMTVATLENLKAEEKQAALQERLRLLYVGMTRAADELYICGSLNKEDADRHSKDSWHAHMLQVFAANSGLPDLRRVMLDHGFGITRFGAEPMARVATVLKPETEAELPDWATTPVHATPPRGLLLNPSRSSDAFDRDAVRRGIATHKLIELMAAVEPAARRERGLRFATSAHLPGGLVTRMVEVLALPVLAELFGPDGQSEVSLAGTVPGLGVVSGRVDRMAVTPEVIWLLDYKTAARQRPGADHHYVRQMAGYAALLKQAYPGRNVRAALLWTQTGELSWLSEALLTQALDQQSQQPT